jgi:light-independent protochlorophyllide reductase subunit B
MQLTVWTYEGPPHVGAMRVAASMTGVHYVLHAPQGDTYADLLFTMIERRDTRPPVTYTTFQGRDLGKDTAALFTSTARSAYERFRPEVMLVGSSCTAELIQDDPAGLGKALGLPIPVVPLELSAYSHRENWGAQETLYRLVRALCPGERAPEQAPARRARTVNILGPTSLGFRHRDDVVELEKLLATMGIGKNVVAPRGSSPADLRRLPDAVANISLYPEVSDATARYLEKTYGQPYTRTVPIGMGATRDFIHDVARLCDVDAAPGLEALEHGARAPWYSASVDSNYLTGKRVYVFGDATHVLAAARVATEELAFDVVGLGTYSRERAREVRALGAALHVPVCISDDHLVVEEAIASADPELILGTQMERHIAKRRRVPCAVISAPVHVQDFPARYAPQVGAEGTNVLFDTWVQPLMMGLEEHLLHMFREDFEFHPEAPASHLGATAGARHEPAHAPTTTPVSPTTETIPTPTTATAAPPSSSASLSVPATTTPQWTPEAERELRKVPFFVRTKAKKNTERFASERALASISVEVLYDARAHFSS